MRRSKIVLFECDGDISVDRIDDDRLRIMGCMVVDQRQLSNHEKLLTAIGVTVISLALFDISTYLIEEKAMREKSLAHNLEEPNAVLPVHDDISSL